MTDEQLVTEMRGGRQLAVEHMIYRYHAPIFAYLYRMTNSKPLAEDLTQECFLRAIEAIAAGRLPEALRPWLYTIAGNLCRDHWRRSSTRRETLKDDMELGLATDSVVSILERQAEREQVVQALQQLDPDRRELIVLRFYQELKLHEIALILDVPLSTVKSRLYQTLGKLHSALEEEELMPVEAAVTKNRRGNM